MIDSMQVDGVDLREEYGMIMIRQSTLSPPTVDERYLDIPGMDGQLDLTESLTGDVVYKERVQEFQFRVLEKLEKFEEIKTRVSNFLHGKRHEYTLTFDPGHVYSGRFVISAYATHLNYSELTIKVTSDPWKRADDVHIEVYAANGVEAHLINRRRRVSPTIECRAQTVVGYKTMSWVLDPGVHDMNEIVLDPGDNVIFVDSKPFAGTNTWNDVVKAFGDVPWETIADQTWAQIAKYGQTFEDGPLTLVKIDYTTYDL